MLQEGKVTYQTGIHTKHEFMIQTHESPKQYQDLTILNKILSKKFELSNMRKIMVKKLISEVQGRFKF